MKNVIKPVIFFIILFLIAWGLSLFFANKKTIGGSVISVGEIYGEKENSLDYLVLGDSETYTSIVPLEIWHKYGYTGYILGTSAQRLKETKEILINSLKSQKIKLLILETNVIFRENRPRKSDKQFAFIFIDIYKYHDNWKFFIDKNFQRYSGNEKGYIYNTKVKKSLNINYKNETDKRAKIPSENTKYIEDIINICEKNNIKILLLSTPSSKNWNYKKHNSIKDLSDKYNLEFLDLNIDETVDIDWNNDTQDAGDHLNYYGALKVTSRLGEYLNDMNLLEDHREDNYYDYWHNNYDKYILKFSNE